MTDLLIIEDEKLLGSQLKKRFERSGWNVTLASSAAEARFFLFKNSIDPDVVLSDLNLPDGDGLKLLEEYREEGLKAEWVFLSGYGQTPSINRAIELGAVDFLTKPMDEGKLDLAMAAAARGGKAQKQIDRSARQAASKYSLESFVGQSDQAAAVRKLIGKLCNVSFTSLLIQGETGSGKGLAARILHYAGPRAGQPFVEFNCAAIPTELLESELFGHEAGSFSGAKGQHKGLLEQANGGTLFLDEIGEMDLAIQVKLLKAIEEREFRRVGGEKAVQVDIQVLSASNRDLRQMVEDGDFREDLFHRLSVFEISLPPLRERTGDIEHLSQLIVAELNASCGTSIKGLSKDLLASFRTYAWPGNVRELRNVLERAVLLADGPVLDTDDVALGHQRASSGQTNADVGDAVIIPLDGSVSLDEAEMRLIEAVLERENGNVVASARLLGTTREKLRYRMQKHNMAAGAERCA